MLVEEIQTAIEARYHCWVTHRGAVTTAASLSTCQPPALPGAKKSPQKGWPHAGCQALGPDLLCPWPLAFVHTCCQQGPCNPGSCSISVSCPHWGRTKCSRAALGADSCEWPTHRGEAKTTAETRGRASKEQEQKSSHAAAQATDWIPVTSLVNTASMEYLNGQWVFPQMKLV